MEPVHIEDSIDDLISLLNAQKTATPNLRETTNIPTDPDVFELGNLLNANTFYPNTQQNKLPIRNLSAQSSKVPGKPLAVSQRQENRVQTKTDFVSRNFFNKTTTYSNSNSVDRTKEYNENKVDQENTNLTQHPKALATGSIRYLKFEPLLKDIKIRPKTPPDYGYYFKFNLSDVRLIRNLLEENGFRETNNSNSFSILWSTGPIKNEVYQYLGYYQKVNHFPRSQEITRKDAMHRNISRMQTAYGLKNFNFIPKSFILPNEAALLENDAEKNKGSWYIVKPQASSQGRGIFITDDVDEILAKQNNQIIVSQYINDPFLINDLKFDLRVYVAVTCVNPLRIYIYKEGLARFATVPYTKEGDKYKNRFIHLTNYSINKKSEAFVQNDDAEDEESCSKWSFATFKAYLETIGIDHKSIFQKIEDLVIKTILSIESILFTANVSQVPQRHNCFELFGFDVLLDSKLKPWLLEVNLSPSLGCESALDLKIKSELIADLFNLTGIAPLDQRTYIETSFFGKNQNVLSYGGTAPNFDKKSQNSMEAKSMENLTSQEKAVIKETNEEWERKGNFKRIFPSANVLEYKNYFESDRPYNALLRNVICNNMKKPSRKPDVPKQPINPKKFC